MDKLKDYWSPKKVYCQPQTEADEIKKQVIYITIFQLFFVIGFSVVVGILLFLIII